MFNSAPETPKVADPLTTINAQTASNESTARMQATLNNANQVTPYGNVSWTQPYGSDQWLQTTTFSPEQDALYKAQIGAETGAVQLAGQQIPRIANALNSKVEAPSLVTTPSMDAMTQGFDQGPGVQTGFATGTGPTPTYNAGGSVLMSLGQGGPIQGQVGPTGQIQTGISNMTSPASTFDPGQQVQGQVGAGDFNQSVRAAQDAVYGQAASRLDPQWNRDQQQLQAQLAAQGLGQNSDAYKNAMSEFNRAKTDAYQQANFNAVQAGLQAQQQGYGQQLQSGQFANQAANQQYQQGLGSAQFYNQAAQQALDQQLAAGGFTNAAQAQQYGQAANNMQLANAAQAQGFAQGQAGAEFANAAQQQQNQQNLQAQQAYNQAAAQQYAQNQGAAAFGNEAAAQIFGQNQASTAFGNQAKQQDFQNRLQQGQFINTAQQQDFQNRVYNQNQAINQMSALLGLGQVQAPQALPYNPAQVANTNVLGSYQLAQQGNQANYQAQMQNYGDMMGGLFNLGKSAIGAFSDRRLKRDIHPVGERDGNVIYLYKLRGEDTWTEGVMAQEVQQLRPDCVHVGPDGWLRVNYRRLAA